MKPYENARKNACRKAMSIARNYPCHLVIGADTIVVIGSKILGKPKSRLDAKATFFTLGWINDRFPRMVKEIHNAGHEVA